MANDQPSVVLLSAEDQHHQTCRALFERNGWCIQHFRSFAAYAAVSKAGTAVVFTDYALPDGPWTKVLTHARTHAPASQIIVHSRLADEHLWAEVMCLGGFDVFSDPFDEKDLMRSASTAWLESRLRSEVLAGVALLETEKAPVL